MPNRMHNTPTRFTTEGFVPGIITGVGFCVWPQNRVHISYCACQIGPNAFRGGSSNTALDGGHKIGSKHPIVRAKQDQLQLGLGGGGGKRSLEGGRKGQLTGKKGGPTDDGSGNAAWGHGGSGAGSKPREADQLRDG
jgi:hypothetical protein